MTTGRIAVLWGSRPIEAAIYEFHHGPLPAPRRSVNRLEEWEPEVMCPLFFRTRADLDEWLQRCTDARVRLRITEPRGSDWEKRKAKRAKTAAV